MSPLTLRARGRTLDFSELRAPLLMGIVNATPDSFSDAGDLPDTETRIAHAHRLVAAGAAILDIGGESAFGGRPVVPAQEEIARVVPVIEGLRDFDVLISVDTYKPEVARAAIAAGAQIVNDVSGLLDPELADVCAATGAGLVLMHTRIKPKGTLLDPGFYDDVVGDVIGYLAERVAVAEARGCKRSQLLVDPGPDFAKTPAQTVAVLREMPRLKALGLPILMAISRKDFLGAITGRGPRERGAATLAALYWAADAGAQIVRVHDVAAAADLLSVRAVLAGDRVLKADEGLTADRYPAADSG